MSEDEQLIDMWIWIEDVKEAIDAICEEEMEELETNTKPGAIDNADDDNEPEFMEVSIDESDIFSYCRDSSKARSKCSNPWCKRHSNSAPWWFL